MQRSWVRAALTLAAPVLVFFASAVPLPGLDLHALGQLLGYRDQGDLSSLGVFSLGLMPLFSAFALVELAALIVPRWRTLRHGGVAGRSSLMRSALAVTLVLSLVQSFFVMRYLQAMRLVDGGWNGTLIMLTLMAGVFLLIGLATLVGRFGLLNGYVALTAGGALVAAVDPGSSGRIAMILSVEPARLAAYLAVLGAMAAVTWFMLRDQRRAPDELRLRLPSSGLAPLETAVTLLALPSLLWSWGLDVGSLVSLIAPGSQTWFLIEVLVIVVSSLLFSHWFNHPRRHAALLEQLEGPLDRGAVHTALAALAPAAAMRSAGFVAAAALASLLGMRVVQGLLSSTSVLRMSGLGSEVLLGVVVTAAIMDLAGEWRARRTHGALVAVWPEHRLYAVDPIVRVLAGAGIVAFPRSAHVRALLQFFGPWVPVEILVPEAQADEARALLAARLTPR